MSDIFTELFSCEEEEDEDEKDAKENEKEFLETFPTPLHCKRPEFYDRFWVFWSQDHHHEIQQQEGFQIINNNNVSFSADVVETLRTTISAKIKHAFSSMVKISGDLWSIIQFWAPVTTIDGRHLLSASGQPFAVGYPFKELSKYRLRCVECQNDDYDDVNNKHPAAIVAFLNRLPQAVSFQSLKRVTPPPLADSALECGLSTCFMMPICFPSQSTSSCIGVVDFSTHSFYHMETIIAMIRALEEVGLGVFQLQQRIPSQIIHGFKPVKAEVEEALKKIVCETNDIVLAQVWISFEDDNHVSFSSYLQGTPKKQMLSLKLTGYLPDTSSNPYFDRYYGLCDMFPLEMGEDFVEKTLEDNKPRFCNDVSKLSGDTLVKQVSVVRRLAICLNSIHTGDFCYAFEFNWRYNRGSDVKVVEELLLNLKELLPSFKLASGAELGDELDVIYVGDSTPTETEFLKIFKGKRLSAIPEMLEEGRNKPIPMGVDNIAPLEAKYKTTPIQLSRDVIEQQFGNTEIEAAENITCADIVEDFSVTISQYVNYLQQSIKEAQMVVDNYMVPSERTCTTTLTLLNRGRQFGNTTEEATQKQPRDSSEKILQENILLHLPEALERGKKPMVENNIAPSAREYKTAPILLFQEAIECQYGNTMKEAAKNLNVSISTLKRKCKVFGISEWQGPNPAKRKVNDSSNQSYKNEDYEGAVQDSSAINKNENTLTIKAKYAEDMIKFHLGISEATFKTVEEEIGKKLKLSHGSYKLKYLDEDNDWILLASDQDMTDYIKSSKNLGRIVVRLRVTTPNSR